jgi:hypothetical protein
MEKGDQRTKPPYEEPGSAMARIYAMPAEQQRAYVRAIENTIDVMKPKVCPIIEKPQPLKVREVSDLKIGEVMTEDTLIVTELPLCPLCKKPLGENNHDTVVLNGKPIICHKTCPEVS